jgi:hypothetical protein
MTSTANAIAAAINSAMTAGGQSQQPVITHAPRTIQVNSLGTNESVEVDGLVVFVTIISKSLNRIAYGL